MRLHVTERGEISAFQMTLLTIVMVGVVGILISVFLATRLNALNARQLSATTASQEETRTVAKCSFQFAAYRSQYSQGSNSNLQPVIGPGGKPLSPYAGLKLPPALDISRHLASNCQKYLIPFISAAKESP